MTDKEINPSTEGADLNLQRFKMGHALKGVFQIITDIRPLVISNVPFEIFKGLNIRKSP